jgi:hypothetical protein
MIDAERLIKLIYDGVADEAAWNDALAKVAGLVRAAGVGLGIQDMKTHEFRGLGDVGIDKSLTPTYRRLAPGNRIWQEVAARKQALTGQMVVRKTEFMRTELYADWFAPQRFHSVVAAPTLFENDASAVIVAFGDRSRPDFDARDLHHVGLLLATSAPRSGFASPRSGGWPNSRRRTSFWTSCRTPFFW